MKCILIITEFLSKKDEPRTYGFSLQNPEFHHDCLKAFTDIETLNKEVYYICSKLEWSITDEILRTESSEIVRGDHYLKDQEKPGGG